MATFTNEDKLLKFQLQNIKKMIGLLELSVSTMDSLEPETKEMLVQEYGISKTMLNDLINKLSHVVQDRHEDIKKNFTKH